MIFTFSFLVPFFLPLTFRTNLLPKLVLSSAVFLVN